MALLEPSIPYCRNSGLAVLFETQVARSPRAVALVFGTSTLTYEQLNADANRLARLLIREGVRPGDRVAFCLERSPLLVLGILAILKAGAVYVPLDPAYPCGASKRFSQWNPFAPKMPFGIHCPSMSGQVFETYPAFSPATRPP